MSPPHPPTPKGAQILCQSVLIVVIAVIFQERCRRDAFVKCFPVRLIFTGQQSGREAEEEQEVVVVVGVSVISHCCGTRGFTPPAPRRPRHL